MSIYNSLLTENDYNIETRWSDDIKISESEIRGVSSMTKSLVSPPYFSRPCTSSSLSQFVYKMQTTMYKYGSDGCEKVKGARLKTYISHCLIMMTIVQTVPLLYSTTLISDH